MTVTSFVARVRLRANLLEAIGKGEAPLHRLALRLLDEDLDGTGYEDTAIFAELLAFELRGLVRSRREAGLRMYTLTDEGERELIRRQKFNRAIDGAHTDNGGSP